MKLSPILDCNSNAGGTCNFISIQINNEYDVANNIWYTEKEDFTANSREATYSATTDDNTPSGNAREKLKVNSFNQTGSIAFEEQITSTFLRALHQVQTQNDEYIKRFMECGINIRRVRCFEDGSQTIITHRGVTTTSMTDVFSMVDGADNEITMDWQFGNEPEVVHIGFSAPLPKDMKEVTATVTNVVTTADLETTITNVVDTNNLVVPTVPIGNEWRVDVYNKDTYELVATGYSDGTSPVDIASLDTGKYKIAVGYHYFVDSQGADLYKYINIQEIEII